MEKQDLKIGFSQQPGSRTGPPLKLNMEPTCHGAAGNPPNLPPCVSSVEGVGAQRGEIDGPRHPSGLGQRRG